MKVEDREQRKECQNKYGHKTYLIIKFVINSSVNNVDTSLKGDYLLVYKIK